MIRKHSVKGKGRYKSRSRLKNVTSRPKDPFGEVTPFPKGLSEEVPNGVLRSFGPSERDKGAKTAKKT